MLPDRPASPGETHTIKMLAILEQWKGESGCHTDNTEKYMLLVLFKLGLGAAVFHLCCRKLYTSFLNMCSLSLVLADFVMLVFLACLGFLGTERSPVPLCFLLANASVTYGALPLPMTVLGLLQYCLEGTVLCNQSTFCKYLRNAVLVSLVWTLTVLYSVSTVKVEMTGLEYTTQIKALVCGVEESAMITYFILTLFIAVICALLPFLSNIPKWLKEADRISEEREEHDNQRSDLFTSSNCTETKIIEEDCLEKTAWPRPPLWLSLTLGFALFWMPYLGVSVACLVFGFGVPAYITVNVLWLECTNSLLTGVVFLAKSSMQGPYSHLPENVCLWHVYWHLSKGVGQQQLPKAVFNPSKAKRTTLLYV